MTNCMEQYLKAFDALKQKRWVADVPWVRRLREEAMASFVEKGFPTKREEAWRYTDLTTIRESSFVFEAEPALLPQSRIEELQKEHGANLIVFLNGRYVAEASLLSDNVEVVDLQKALEGMPELELHCGSHVDYKQNAFVALNTAFLGDGVLIRIPEGQILKAPLRILFIADPLNEGEIFQPRVLILAGKRSEGTFVEHYGAVSNKSYFTNAVTEIILGEGVTIHHCKIQNEGKRAFHIGMTGVSQEKGSHFSSWALSSGSQLMRNDCHVELAKEEAACALNGLYLGDGDQHLDQQTFVDHRKPAGKSRQFFKGLMAGNSRGVFSGKVLVRQGAVQTDATQTNKNLLLSDGAKVDTQPQLEIDADDVKCSHGAAVGQLQEDAIFYLRARGIGERDAGRMLARGFVQEVIDAAGQDFFKKELEDLVSQKLESQFLQR